MSSRFVVVSLVALALRSLQVAANGSWSDPLRGQPTEEVRIAQHLAEGRGFATPFDWGRTAGLSASAHSPPGYPFLLAGLIRATGSGRVDSRLPYRIALALGALAGSIAVGVLAMAGGRVAGHRGFWAAGVVATAWPTLITQSGILWDTPFAMLAIASGAFMVAGPARPPGLSARRCLAFGTFGGLASLFNPTVAPFLAASTATRLAFAGRSIRPWLLVGMTWFLCLVPWTARNTLAFHRWIPIRSNAGLELWLGNLEDADGSSRSTMHRHPMDDPAERDRVARIGEGDYMREKMGQASALITNDLGRFARRTWRRVLLYWFGDVTRPTRLLGVTFAMPFGINLPKLAPNALLLILSLIGLARWQPPAGRWALGFGILVLPLPYYLTHVSPNYRAIADPLLCLLAGVAIARCMEWASPRRSVSEA